ARQDQTARVSRVDPQVVVIDVDAARAGGAELPPPVARDVQRDAQHVEAPRVGRVDADLREVERPGAQVVDLLPGFAAVARAEDSSRLDAPAVARRLTGHLADAGAVSLDDGVHQAWVAAPHRQPDPPHPPARQPARQARPRLAAVAGAVDPDARAE